MKLVVIGTTCWNEVASDYNSSHTGTTTADPLMTIVGSLESIGGGDYPEATKIGLARVFLLMR